MEYCSVVVHPYGIQTIGKGLRKLLQGITTLTEAKLRKGKGTIGLYGPERPTMTRVSSSGIIEGEPAEE
ncbi:hypothetical protein TNCT_252011 [Trichonephila clavata]|uniref:Uncharacterized protein n=1 Tax=Trichonephila clavata TaxID=2740835 RepID=A0A8X6J5H8_TRICU|nr:hypothetical protein TNCT_252011 [Trichonephila clavata]